MPNLIYVTIVTSVVAGFAGGVIGSYVTPRHDTRVDVLEAYISGQLNAQTRATWDQINRDLDR